MIRRLILRWLFPPRPLLVWSPYAEAWVTADERREEIEEMQGP